MPQWLWLALRALLQDPGLPLNPVIARLPYQSRGGPSWGRVGGMRGMESRYSPVSFGSFKNRPSAFAARIKPGSNPPLALKEGGPHHPRGFQWEGPFSGEGTTAPRSPKRPFSWRQQGAACHQWPVRTHRAGLELVPILLV